MSDDVRQAIVQDGIVAIARTSRPPEELVRAATALVKADIRFIEVTMNSASAADAIRAIARQLRGSVRVGAGTVLTTDEADEAIAAGAEYLISPHLGRDLAEHARDKGIAYLPGVMTPTEVHDALLLGSTIVKLFPASTLGPAHLSTLRGPFPDLQVMATGGVGMNDVATWAGAGARALGVGSMLIRDEEIDEESAAGLYLRGLRLREAWDSARGVR